MGACFFKCHKKTSDNGHEKRVLNNVPLLLGRLNGNSRISGKFPISSNISSYVNFPFFAAEMNNAKLTSNVGGAQETIEDVLLVYSRHCPGAVEWAKYLHKLYTELSKHKGKLR